MSYVCELVWLIYHTANVFSEARLADSIEYDMGDRRLTERRFTTSFMVHRVSEAVELLRLHLVWEQDEQQRQ